MAYRPDGVVRLLTKLVSIVFFTTAVLGTLVLAGAPALKVLAGDDPGWVWGVPVAATLAETDAAVDTPWGPARLDVEDVRATLRMPIGRMPWSVFGMLWAHLAVAMGLMLLVLHHLRRIFQIARGGAPFDAGNAVRLRSIGVLLIALAVVNGIAEFVTMLAIRRSVESGSIVVPAGIHVNVMLVLIALALVALAEIFRRGTELESEQALVI